MPNLHKICLLFAIAALSIKTHANGHKFCILDSDKETENIDDLCEISATVFTQKEKEIFYRTLCKDQVMNIKGDYSFIKVRDGVFEERQSYKRLCQEQHSPLLMGWLPWQIVKDKIMPDFNKTEINFYIAKATNKEKSNTELCFFSQATMLSNDVTCQLMIFEDDSFGADSDINVLVEILPLSYEIRNVTYEPWTKIKQSYKTVLGKSVLKNPSNENKTVYGSIEYSFVEVIKLNTSALPIRHPGNISLIFEHEDGDISLTKGSANIEIRKKSFFGQVINPKSSLNVELTGQWTEHFREFRGDLFENFGYGIRQYVRPLDVTTISFVKISNIEPVFENLNISRVLEIDVTSSSRFTQGGLVENITTVNSTSQRVKKTWNHPYPEFFPYFAMGCLIVVLGLYPVGNMIMILKRGGKF